MVKGSRECLTGSMQVRLKAHGESRAEVDLLSGKNKIAHTTVYSDLIALQVANGDELLEEHITKGAKNAQYISKFSSVMLLDAIDTWLERKLFQSLRSIPYFFYLRRRVSRQ